jgi:hypothetical protein
MLFADLTSPRREGFHLQSMVRPRSERRRYGRIQLDTPLRARFADVSVRVIEISVSGFLVAHEGRFAAGDPQPLLIAGDGTLIEADCVVARSHLYRLAKGLGEKSLYHTGLRIVRFANDGFNRLRNLIGERILRALEEQKANAKGIPPLAAYMYQPEKGELFRRCEFIDNVWRKTETIRPHQPQNGFTVYAEVDPYYVEMLCETWEQTTPEGRRLTQLLAELSISTAEGVPTRRYVP